MSHTKSLWECPKCGKKFVTRNMWHSCSRYTVDDFFQGKNPRLRLLFDAYVAMIRGICGEIIINVDKSRISFQTRTRFAGVPGMTRDELVIGFWLKYRIESPRFTKVEFIPPNNYVYQLKVKETADLDDEVAAWIREACKVGNQEEIK
jgi:hypothetical protein